MTGGGGEIINMQYVGFGRRLVATLLDGLIIGVVQAILGVLLGAGMTVGVSNAADGTGGGILANILSLVISIGYVVGYQGMTGQTLGKKVMGIRVVDASGNKPSYFTFFLRDVIGKLVSSIILLIGYFMILWDGKKQGVHDKIASTYVVKA